jgi:hypothetical protein
MKLSFLTCLTTFFLISVCKQQEKILLVNDVKNLYKDLIVPEFNTKGNRKSYSFTINRKLPKTHPFYKLGKNYSLYVDYLIWNYTKIDGIKILNNSNDSISATKEYLEQLKSDSLFNSNFLALAYGVLKEDNIALAGYSLPSKQIINEKIFIETASRFFYAHYYDSIQKNTHWSICVGKNPYYNSKEFPKFPHVEAFVFMEIMNGKYKQKQLTDEFLKNARKINIEIDSIKGADNKLINARTKMAERMALNETLKEKLFRAYKNHEEVLPFTLH